jgi:hypothetical protein
VVQLASLALDCHSGGFNDSIWFCAKTRRNVSALADSQTLCDWLRAAK